MDRPSVTDIIQTSLKRDEVPSRVDEYVGFHDESKGGDVQARKANYTTMVNDYYDLVTDFYEFGWGQAFHFAPRHNGESFPASIARHEFFLALRLGLKPGMKVVDVGCGVGGPMRAIARFSGATVVGVNNNDYQIRRGTKQNATDEHIGRLVTVQQVLKESMRLYPPVPVVTRYAAKDVELAGEHIKAGTLIGLPIYVIHRHRKLWDDPDRFDPARFAPEREASYSRYQFMPFGAGPRICIGAAFALVEATVMLATLVRAARFESPPVQKPLPVSRVLLVPKGGMPLRVTLRGGVERH
jgi:Cytochrome P450/Mycolic acid cyclopropane synthetase